MPPKLREWRTPDGSLATSLYFTQVQEEVVQWWLQHRRNDLPWRPPSGVLPPRPPFFNPYAIWVSEVMSQQTLMATVISYFTRWMARFPTIEALSRATEDEVRAVWAGMGYYRRAMYLLKGAQYLVELHEEENRQGPVMMPSTAVELLKVPGVGPYTAGAIASVCFGEPVIATDGNVVRVVSRLRGERDFDPKLSVNIKLAGTWGQALMSGGAGPEGRVAPNPGGLNQGLMEIGASVCRPNGEPLCAECPLRDRCCAWALRQTDTIPSIGGLIPLRGSRATKRHETVVCVVHEVVQRADQREPGRFVVARRPREGLLGGMLEFPSLPVTPAEADDDDDDKDKAAARVSRAAKTLGCGAKPAASPSSSSPSAKGPPALVDAGTVTHVFSHIDMTVRVFHVRWLDPTPAELDEEDVFASAFSGARSAREDTVCASIAVALRREADTTAKAGNHVPTRRKVGSGTKTAPRSPARTPRQSTPDETVESRLGVLTEGDVRKAAASRLMLKILETVTCEVVKTPRTVKRKRSNSP